MSVQSNQIREPEESRDVSNDPLNSILLLIYELSIANAPYPPADCRDIAEKVAARVAEARAVVAKQKRRALAFQEGYRDKSFEVTGLEIQLMDLRAHGVDKVTARQNASLRTKLLSACIERNEAREALRGLLRGHKCWCSTWVGGEHEPECEAARAALSLVDAPKTKERN